VNANGETVQCAYCPVCAVQTVELSGDDARRYVISIPSAILCCGPGCLEEYQRRIAARLDGLDPHSVRLAQETGVLYVSQ